METSGKLIKRPKILVAAAIIVAAGVVGAYQFRLVTSPTSPADRPPGPWRAEDFGNAPSTDALHPTTPAPALAGRIEPVAGSDTEKKGAGTTIPGAGALNNADRYADVKIDHALLPSHNASAASPTGPVDWPFTPAAGGLGSRIAEEVEGLSSLNGPIAVHKVADGDTLMKLAEKYLGRADRYPDLFHYNRDVLRDPEVLPIGAELRIPPPSALLQPAEQPAIAPLAPLHPGGTVPTTANPKQPGTFQPAAANRNAPAQPAKPKTYTVQAGDNLVDIARKLYGDGRRHEQLFEANRQKLKTPLDLKPGIELVVP